MNELEFESYKKYLDQETDRGVALVAGSILENWLDKIRVEFISRSKKIAQAIFDTKFNLYNFNAKVDLLKKGLSIKKFKINDLKKMWKIRNEFAHNLDIDEFNNPKLRIIFSEIEFLKKLEQNNKWIKDSSLRDKFIMLLFIYAGILEVHLKSIKIVPVNKMLDSFSNKK